MFHNACLAGAACLFLMHLPGNADEVLLPAIEPSLTVPVPATCFASRDQTASIDGKIVAVTRRTVEAPAGEIAVYEKRDGAWTQTTMSSVSGGFIVLTESTTSRTVPINITTSPPAAKASTPSTHPGCARIAARA